MTALKRRDRHHVIAIIKERDGNRCKYCRKKFLNDKKSNLQLTLDHYIPKCLGGSNHIENIVLACLGCNNLKANLMPEEFKALLKRERKNGKYN